MSADRLTCDSRSGGAPGERGHGDYRESGTHSYARSYAAPFGRYEGTRPAEYPANEMLVGRERERARMLDWLLTLGSRGAYLITGYRGVGKTSFVQFCTKRYEEDVYGRYQQSKVGRALFWDRILTVGVITIALVLPLFASQLFELAADLNASPAMPVSLFRCVASAPLLLLALYPFIYACNILSVATRRDAHEKPSIDAAVSATSGGAPATEEQSDGAPSVATPATHAAPRREDPVLEEAAKRPAPEASPAAQDDASSGAATTLPAPADRDATGEEAGLAPAGGRAPGEAVGTAVAWVRTWSARAVRRCFSPVGSAAVRGWTWIVSVVKRPQVRWWLLIPGSAVFAFVGPFGSPTVGMIYFLLLAAWIHAVVYGLSIEREVSFDRDPDAAGFAHGSNEWTTDPVIFGASALGAVLWGYLLLAWENNAGAARTSAGARDWVGCCLVFFASLTVLGFLARAVDSAVFARFLEGAGLPESATRRRIDAANELLRNSLGKVVFVVAVGASLAYVCLAGESAPYQPRPVVLPVLALFALPALYAAGRWKHRKAWFFFRPRPRVVLVLKGVFSMVFAAQLMRPLLSRLVTLISRMEHVPAAIGRLRTLADSACGTTRWKQSLVCTTHPFVNASDEHWWLVLAIAFTLWILYLEYHWVIRPSERARSDDAYDPYDPDDRPESLVGGSTRMKHFRTNREFAQATIFWSLFSTWLPVLTVRVNLGFDNLSHAHVVRAMLVGLRDEYHRMFISWRSRLGLVWRLMSTGFLVLLSFALGEWIAGHSLPPGTREAHPTVFAVNGFLKTEVLTLAVAGTDPPTVRLERDATSHHLIEYVLPSYEDGRGLVFAVRAQHCLLFVGLLLFARTFGRRMRLFYYAEIYARLNAILDALSSNVRLTRQPSRWGLSSLWLTMQGPSDASEKDTPRQDPRSIEHTFLEVLRDVQEQYLPLPAAGHVISLPAPRVTFVFDELDKIKARSPSRTEGEPALDALSADRERTRQARGLLADMKNLLSVAPARFIFVGGRDLHDEWLADRTAREPLLSNVFDAEIYLPTLLVDPIREREGDPPNTLAIPNVRMLSGTYAYLNAQLSRARELHSEWQKRKRFRWLWMGLLRDPAEYFFVQEPDRTPPSAGAEKAPYWLLYDAKGIEAPIPPEWTPDFFEDFARYLAFRSRGNPKRLDALIESFVRPVGQAVRKLSLRWPYFDCQHVLLFTDAQRFSIRFVAEIFRRLQPVVDVRVEHRDDKIVRSAFYLADFLFKFHRRAFSWSSLERIDELLHSHRAPDLRGLLGELVGSWSQCFIQPILIGTQGFRFRSEMSAEIRYVSRRSEGEMAAFNFTLDEAQALRREYQQRLERLTGAEESLFEVHAALGELCDFDEDYEEARRHYAAAMDALDARAAKTYGQSGTIGVYQRLIGQSGSAELRRQVDWGVSRLRLMLKFGMTYERSYNYEQALIEYRDARTLARALWLAMLDEYGRADAYDRTENRGRHRLTPLKHLHIVYQPLFASAWVAEKAPSTIDSSLAIVEEGLWDLRQRLPFVRLKDVDASKAPANVTHGHFALVMADLHHNAGDLYFLKGCQFRTSGTGAGYLLQAHYHYACAVHEVRRYIQHRLMSAEAKLSPPGNLEASPNEAVDSEETPAARKRRMVEAGVRYLPRDSWPEFLLRQVTAALFDLAETWLARVPLSALTNSIGRPSRGKLASREELKREFFDWIDGKDGRLDRWIGSWAGTEPEPPHRQFAYDGTSMPKPPLTNRGRVITLPTLGKRAEGSPPGGEEVEAYLLLSELGAQLLEDGGHYEEAAGEHIRIASSVETLLSSAVALQDLWRLERQDATLASGAISKPDKEASKDLRDGEESSGAPLDSGKPMRFQQRLLERACRALDHGAELLQRSVPVLAGRPWSANVLNGPAHAERIACSLGLIAFRLEPDMAQRFKAAAERWSGHREKTDDVELYFRKRLEVALARNAYPVLNHLMTLRALILHSAQEETKEQYPSSAHVDEMLQINRDYASPLHFTPFHYGVPLALWLKIGKNDGRIDPTMLKHESLRVLACSQQMYSSQEAYYRAISDQYYLDGDMNDRSTHVRHAIQMMGRDLTAQLLESVGGSKRAPEGAEETGADARAS